MKKKVLILTSYYYPSVKAGGPVQSIRNLVEELSEKIDFYIITSDRDIGDDKPFNNIRRNQWSDVGKAKVFYTDTQKLNIKKTARIINSVNYDCIYLNSFFSYKFSIVPLFLRKFNMINRKPVILAPRGEFSPGALNLKYRKKKSYINIANIFKLYKDVTWHATTEMEKNHIQSIFNKQKEIIVANNLTANYNKLSYSKDILKKKGELKIIFISRIHPKKNLKAALEYLKYINGKVYFNIYGPIEDKKYWSECEKLIEELPSNIKVMYHGAVEHDSVIDIFIKNHVFLFPTLGENYGHVISEALIGGCPVIISDQTPWRKLEIHNAGWDIKLNDKNRFIDVIQKCVDLESDAYRELSQSAFNYGKKTSNNIKDIEATVSLFNLN
jgi:glycosyltransferase involved in cell wall biosynthesis